MAKKNKHGIKYDDINAGVLAIAKIKHTQGLRRVLLVEVYEEEPGKVFASAMVQVGPTDYVLRTVKAKNVLQILGCVDLSQLAFAGDQPSLAGEPEASAPAEANLSGSLQTNNPL